MRNVEFTIAAIPDRADSVATNSSPVLATSLRRRRPPRRFRRRVPQGPGSLASAEVEFAQCTRPHGAPKFPDPLPGQAVGGALISPKYGPK